MIEGDPRRRPSSDAGEPDASNPLRNRRFRSKRACSRAQESHDCRDFSSEPRRRSSGAGRWPLLLHALALLDQCMVLGTANRTPSLTTSRGKIPGVPALSSTSEAFSPPDFEAELLVSSPKRKLRDPLSVYGKRGSMTPSACVLLAPVADAADAGASLLKHAQCGGTSYDTMARVCIVCTSPKALTAPLYSNSRDDDAGYTVAFSVSPTRCVRLPQVNHGVPCEPGPRTGRARNQFPARSWRLMLCATCARKVRRPPANDSCRSKKAGGGAHALAA